MSCSPPPSRQFCFVVPPTTTTTAVTKAPSNPPLPPSPPALPPWLVTMWWSPSTTCANPSPGLPEALPALVPPPLPPQPKVAHDSCRTTLSYYLPTHPIAPRLTPRCLLVNHQCILINSPPHHHPLSLPSCFFHVLFLSTSTHRRLFGAPCRRRQHDHRYRSPHHRSTTTRRRCQLDLRRCYMYTLYIDQSIKSVGFIKYPHIIQANKTKNKK